MGKSDFCVFVFVWYTFVWNKKQQITMPKITKTYVNETFYSQQMCVHNDGILFNKVQLMMQLFSLNQIK